MQPRAITRSSSCFQGSSFHMELEVVNRTFAFLALISPLPDSSQISSSCRGSLVYCAAQNGARTIQKKFYWLLLSEIFFSSSAAHSGNNLALTFMYPSQQCFLYLSSFLRSAYSSDLYYFPARPFSPKLNLQLSHSQLSRAVSSALKHKAPSCSIQKPARSSGPSVMTGCSTLRIKCLAECGGISPVAHSP